MGFIKFNFSVNVGRMLINMMIDEVLMFIKWGFSWCMLNFNF